MKQILMKRGYNDLNLLKLIFNFEISLGTIN